MARYCARDVDALRSIVARGWVRVPGGNGTSEAAVRQYVARPDYDGADGQPNNADGDDAQQHAAGGSAPKRPRRAHVAPPSYDETTRRKRKRSAAPAEGYHATTRYVARCTRVQKTALKRGIEVGPRTIERVVRARYEWRDAGLRPVTAAKRRLWDSGDW